MAPTNQTEPVRIVIVIKERIATLVKGPHEAWVALIVLSVVAGIIEVGAAKGIVPGSGTEFLRISCYLLTISAAALIGGVLVGFLFGIPRTLSGSRLNAAQSINAAANGPDQSEARGSKQATPEGTGFAVNTNLEQISDWLTKILVGVGLTQIAKLSDGLSYLAHSIEPGLGGAPAGGALGVTIVLFYSICGFLIGYLWTRINLTRAFVNVQAETMRQLEAKVTNIASTSAVVAAALSDVQAQPEKDAAALGLAQRMLDPTSGDQPVSQEQLNTAVREASPALKVQLFYMARRFRKDRKGNIKEAKVLGRVIPILRALCACDSKDIYHRNHAQLAYALTEKEEPEIEEAIREISKAIEIRNKGEQSGYWLYELLRAKCNIRLFQNIRGARLMSQARFSITTDLRLVVKNEPAEVLNDPLISSWLDAEKIRVEELSTPA